MNDYQKGKEKAVNMAIEWQQNASKMALSYADLYRAGDFFRKLAKRYGLIKEFRENGII